VFVVYEVACRTLRTTREEKRGEGAECARERYPTKVLRGWRRVPQARVEAPMSEGQRREKLKFGQGPGGPGEGFKLSKCMGSS